MEATIVWSGGENLRDQLVSLDELELAKDNPRRGDVDQIAASFKRFGQTHPIVITPDKVVLAGNHRIRAARLLGWTHIAAVEAQFSSSDEEMAYLLADNGTQEAGYTDPEQQMTLAEGLGDIPGVSEDQLHIQRTLGRTKRDELAKITELKQHSENYKEHDERQLDHLTASLKEHGFYRNVVIANDGTILAGHGLVEAAKKVGLKAVPVTRLPHDPDSPEAMKVVAGDNEIGRLAQMDGRQLSEMLRKVRQQGDLSELIGSGYDAQTLASLVMVSRHENEIADFDAAAHWVGLPEFEQGKPRIQIVVSFETEEAREEFSGKLGLSPHYRKKQVWSTWWPPREREDLKSLKFDLFDGEESKWE